MKALSMLVVGMLVLGVASFAMAARDKGAKAPAGLHGVVVSVDGTNLKIKVKKDEQTVATDANTVVTIDGEAKTLGDLKAGMNVTVTPATGTATKIEAKTAGKKNK